MADATLLVLQHIACEPPAAYEDEMEPLKKYDAALFGGTPTEVPERYRVANPITYVDRVRVPMLLLVGQNDPRCPSRSVDVYRDRLRALGKPFDRRGEVDVDRGLAHANAVRYTGAA